MCPGWSAAGPSAERGDVHFSSPGRRSMPSQTVIQSQSAKSAFDCPVVGSAARQPTRTDQAPRNQDHCTDAHFRLPAQGSVLVVTSPQPSTLFRCLRPRRRSLVLVVTQVRKIHPGSNIPSTRGPHIAYPRLWHAAIYCSAVCIALSPAKLYMRVLRYLRHSLTDLSPMTASFILSSRAASIPPDDRPNFRYTPTEPAANQDVRQRKA